MHLQKCLTFGVHITMREGDFFLVLRFLSLANTPDSTLGYDHTASCIMKVEGYNAGANKTKEDKKDETKGMKKRK